MKGYLFAVAVASSLALIVGCGSSSGGGNGGSSGSSGGGGDINCTGTIGGQEVCYGYSGLPSTITGSTLCVGGLKQSSSACPTANQTGCCQNIPEGAGTETYTVDECYYKLPSSAVSTLKSTCTTTLKGTWK